MWHILAVRPHPIARCADCTFGDPYSLFYTGPNLPPVMLKLCLRCTKVSQDLTPHEDSHER